MARKTSKPWTIAPLQHIICEPITDPAEQAALDRSHERARRRQRVLQVETPPNGVNAAKDSAPKIAPLQRIVAEPITDPAEQAALDRLRKRAKRKQREAQGKTLHNGVNAAKASPPRGR